MNTVNRMALYTEWLRDIEPITAKGAVHQVKEGWDLFRGEHTLSDLRFCLGSGQHRE